jgi:hypothetical protein
MKFVVFVVLLGAGYGVAHALGASEGWAGAAGWAAALLLSLPLTKAIVAIGWHLRVREAGRSRELYESLDDETRAKFDAAAGVKSEQ